MVMQIGIILVVITRIVKILIHLTLMMMEMAILKMMAIVTILMLQFTLAPQILRMVLTMIVMVI